MQKGVAKELHACELHLRTSGSGIRTWCAKTHSVDKKGRAEGRPFFLILRGSNEIAMFVRGGGRAQILRMLRQMCFKHTCTCVVKL